LSSLQLRALSTVSMSITLRWCWTVPSVVAMEKALNLILLVGNSPWSWCVADSSLSWPLLFSQLASVLGGWDLREKRGGRWEQRGGKGPQNLWASSSSHRHSQSVSGAFTLLRYTPYCRSRNRLCVSCGIFTGSNCSPGFCSRHVNSSQRFTAHAVPTQTVQGQHNHTWVETHHIICGTVL